MLDEVSAMEELERRRMYGKHINPGTDTTINPVIINDTHREKPKELVLHLKKEWFDKIKSGEKTEEYRETTEYWQRRIQLKHFKNIILIRGYPSTRTPENCIVFPWNGYQIKTIGSWERQEMIEVFAMPLRREP